MYPGVLKPGEGDGNSRLLRSCRHNFRKKMNEERTLFAWKEEVQREKGICTRYALKPENIKVGLTRPKHKMLGS